MNHASFTAITVALAALTTLSACSTDEPAETSSNSELNPLFSCIDESFIVAKPLVGAKYDPAQGGLIDPTQSSYIVHTTQIFVPPQSEGDFFTVLAPVLTQLDETEGLVAYGLAADEGCGDYRTIGIWESLEAMYNFVASGAHVVAVEENNNVSEAGRVVHWEASVDEVNALTWDVAKAKLSTVQGLDSY